MHDKIFGGHCGTPPREGCDPHKTLDAATLEGYATELGLDVARWKAAMAGNRAKSRVGRIRSVADQFAVRGTPTFFINGRVLMGRSRRSASAASSTRRSRRRTRSWRPGPSRSALYDELTRGGWRSARMAAGRHVGRQGAGCPAGNCGGGAAPAADPSEGDSKVYKVEVGAAPARGPRDAAVTVVLFSDFQCPFCSRVEPTLAQLEKEYPGKVRVVWKNFPLPFHESARGAALAALAAGEQGRFWRCTTSWSRTSRRWGRRAWKNTRQELGLDWPAGRRRWPARRPPRWSTAT
jgi:thiol-disulfide isomerase/thioredoxin